MYNFDEVIERKGTNCAKWDGWKTHDKAEDVMPLWVADMDFKALPEITEAIIERAKHGVYGYTFVDDEYFQAICDWMQRRHNLTVTPENIVTTPGVVTALKLAVNVFTKPGDAIIINKPVYAPFDGSIDANNRTKIECPMIYDGSSYKMDFELFEQLIVDNDVKMYILCNPHNPIGKVWTKEELQKMGNICKKHGVLVVSDEIHHDFVYPGYQYTSFVNADESFKEFSIICTAPSKTFNIAGIKTSNILFFNDKLKDTFTKAKGAYGFSAEPNIFGIEACKAAYTHGDKWVDELVAYLDGNVKFLDNYLKEKMPMIKLVKPEGLYVVWVDFNALNMSNEELASFMSDEAKVWFNEGYSFGKEGSGFERINIATPRSVLKEALDRLYNALKARNLV